MTSQDPGPYRALVFGASGITGWALVKEALEYPSRTTFDKVLGLTRRPLSTEKALLPVDDERLVLHSGLDLNAGTSQTETLLKQIEGIEAVTHVYFASYVSHGPDREPLTKLNVEALENAVRAVENVCPNLMFWTFQTGGKVYGFDIADKVGLPATPVRESTPRTPEPYASSNFYYAQCDKMKELSQGKNWSFVEVRPDAMSGFVPSNNSMNLAQGIGLFLSFYASHEGAGSQVPYPGPPQAYTALHTDVSQSLLARFHIYASLHPEKSAGEAFNIGDVWDGGVSWKDLWPRLCGYFGLVGVDPLATGKNLDIGEYIHNHKTEVTEWVTKNGLSEGAVAGTSFEFLSVMLGMAVFDRQYELRKAREVLGFTETRDTVTGFTDAFDLMKRAKIIR